MVARKSHEILDSLVRPQTYPLGVKIMDGPGDGYPDFATPSKYGIKISLCQWVSMARRWNRPLAVMGEEINCAPCLAVLGLKRMNRDSALADYFMEMGYFADHGLAVKAAETLSPIPPGKVKGIVLFPLGMAVMEPDLILLYGSPAQMARLAAGFVYQTGELVESATTGFGLSCLSMLKPHWTGKPTLVVPGRGERILAGTEESEMCCSFPAYQMNSLLTGLEKTQEMGTRYPVQKYVLYQPPEIPAFKSLNSAMTDIQPPAGPMPGKGKEA